MFRWFMVEGDATDREIFAIALEQVSGVEAVMFPTNTAVLHHLQTGDIPDVLFLDLDGADAADTGTIPQIRDLPATATLPIVILAGITDLDQVDHAYRNGASVYFQKPDSITATVNLFTHARDHWSRSPLPRATSH